MGQDLYFRLLRCRSSAQKDVSVKQVLNAHGFERLECR
jgi:hypothetical protein